MLNRNSGQLQRKVKRLRRTLPLLYFSIFLGFHACVYNELPQPIDCGANPLTVELVSVVHTECGQQTGSLEVVASGGRGGPWNYRLGDEGEFQSTGIFAGLGAGTYEIVVNDNSGCTSSLEVTILNAAGLNLSVAMSPSGCLANEGSITVNASDGTPPYSYRLDDGEFQEQNVFEGLSSGRHTVRALDASGCEVTQQVRVFSGVSFEKDVKSIISTNCAITGCHNGTQFPDLRSFQITQEYAPLIKVQVVSRGMPLEGALSQEEINTIVCWVDDGAPAN